MPLDWDASSDFPTVVDTLEPITLKDRACTSESTPLAWRFFEQANPIAGSDGAVVAVETTWQVPATEGAVAPSVGGRVISVDGKCSVITRVDRLRAATRWRCVARRVQGRSDIAEWLDLEAALFETEGPPAEPTDWKVESAGVRGFAFRVETATDPNAPASAVDTYRLVLTEPIDATPNHRFRRHAGGAYRVLPQRVDNELGAGWSYDAVLEL